MIRIDLICVALSRLATRAGKVDRRRIFICPLHALLACS